MHLRAQKPTLTTAQIHAIGQSYFESHPKADPSSKKGRFFSTSFGALFNPHTHYAQADQLKNMAESTCPWTNWYNLLNVYENLGSTSGHLAQLITARFIADFPKNHLIWATDGYHYPVILTCPSMFVQMLEVVQKNYIAHHPCKSPVDTVDIEMEATHTAERYPY